MVASFLAKSGLGPEQGGEGRAERRHFSDSNAREMERKIINSSLDATITPSTYKESFDFSEEKEFIKGLTILKEERKSRKNFLLDSTIAMEREKERMDKTARPKMKDADHLLYQSTYKIGFDSTCRKELSQARYQYPYVLPSAATEIYSFDTTTNQRKQQKQIPIRSNYQASFLNYHFNGLGNGVPKKGHHLLKAALATNLTAKDIIASKGKISEMTAGPKRKLGRRDLNGLLLENGGINEDVFKSLSLQSKAAQSSN